MEIRKPKKNMAGRKRNRNTLVGALEILKKKAKKENWASFFSCVGVS